MAEKIYLTDIPSDVFMQIRVIIIETRDKRDKKIGLDVYFDNLDFDEQQRLVEQAMNDIEYMKQNSVRLGCEGRAANSDSHRIATDQGMRP